MKIGGKKPIPWSFYEPGSTRFWVHYGLVILGFVLAVITIIAQWAKPAPYGKHEGQDVGNWGPQIPQRLGHMLSDAIPGVFMFILVFLLYGDQRGYANYIFLVMWLCHYVHRGILYPLLMRYRSTTVALGITLGGGIPNCLYHFMNADFIGSASYDQNYFYDPRFILGIILFILGYITNRWADHKLRSLRETKGEEGCNGYYIPYGSLFELISCPNYFGELVEWIGWSLATWSLAGLVFTLFSAATFIPRSWHNHNWELLEWLSHMVCGWSSLHIVRCSNIYTSIWYKRQFENYPRNRKALIPWIY